VGILIFKGLTARRLYKLVGVKGLIMFGEIVLLSTTFKQMRINAIHAGTLMGRAHS
jgi:hypothetical protein